MTCEWTSCIVWPYEWIVVTAPATCGRKLNVCRFSTSPRTAKQDHHHGCQGNNLRGTWLLCWETLLQRIACLHTVDGNVAKYNKASPVSRVFCLHANRNLLSTTVWTDGRMDRSLTLSGRKPLVFVVLAYRVIVVFFHRWCCGICVYKPETLKHLL